MAKPGLYAKVCFKCKAKNSIKMFYKSSNTSDGLHSWCKQCCQIGNKESISRRYSCFENRVKTFLHTCKKSSIKRGHEFTLTSKDLIDAWYEQQGMCAYSGIEMTVQAAQFTSVSVERINNDIGYTRENTVLVCNAVNKMKTNLPYKDFVTFCKAISQWLENEDGSIVEGKKYG